MQTDKRLIDANALDVIRFIPTGGELLTADERGWNECISFLQTNSKTIDAVEVVHGRWENVTVEAYFVPTIEEKTKRDFPRCSKCHEIQSIAAWTKPFNYCPNCGAKMDGGAS